MYRAVFVLLAVAIASCMACETSPSSEEFQQLYCNSPLVFKGQRTNINIGMGVVPPGYWVSYTYATFNATSEASGQVYRGSTTNPRDIEISREWQENVNSCQEFAFPDTANGYLIFASGGSGRSFSVEPCGSVFTWDCVPQGVKESLPFTC